ncbi:MULTISPECIES: M10 family metallopeptidase C-terminal domain-containing protein [Paracoccus]|uniref:calcium-binding protein n=1 Tax=Paracoccus TaxID=265 RepID=UPI001FB62409|nr:MULTISPECIES: M10 family metallopeptidase C-terminal domain-containing protein [Paracoccus]MCJ1902721.1 M10 family metallopeptidase C-terminal domain-containing protein [Paracoccus versutus]MDF3906384.1 M10 family metallopeptidase C-terminal domain-containing protein [Paracoccus sp. AS002]
MRYRHVATYIGPQAPFVTNITNLRSFSGPDGHALYSITHVGGGIAAYRVTTADLPIEMIGAQPHAASLGYGGTPDASIVTLKDGPVLFGTGLRDALGAGIRLDDQGGFRAGAPLAGPAGLPGDVIRLGQFQTTQGNFLYSARDGQTAFDIWRQAADGTIAHVTQAALPLGSGVQGTEIDDMLVATLADRSFLISASATGNYVAVQMIHADGSVGTAHMLWSWHGLGMDQPSHLATVAVGGVTYLVVAAAQSSSLTTMRLTYEGELLPADHVIDERSTRFAGATALATATLDGRAFVFVGGGDDGLSVFTVLPEGRLMHLATLVDTDDRALADVSALSALVIEGKIALFASSRRESGVTQFVFEPGGIGLTRVVGAGWQSGTEGNDMMQASAETRGLDGGAGDDILIAGSSPVQMTGGAGADIFVAAEVNGKITITDFEPGVDRLDLSFLGMVRNVGQLGFRPESYGIRIFYGNSVIWVMTRDNTMLQASAFDNSLFPIAHYAAPDMRTTVAGTAGNDTLNASRNGSDVFGHAGNDLLLGGPGDDNLQGGAGNDTLRAEAGADTLIGHEGNDLLFGGDGNDSLVGGPGDDTLWGQVGNDLLYGDDGNDLLWGGDGNDLLWGGNGNDNLAGGAGSDTLRGDAGNDTLIGHEGNDLFFGGNGNDSLVGGPGDDTLWGQVGNDLLYGDHGNDLLWGGDGNDLLWGGNGNDNLAGGAGSDTLRGDAGKDTLIGHEGNDLLFGGDGNDSLVGGAGDDTLWGQLGNDTLSGDDGNDLLYGGDGSDLLWGGNGDDLIYGGDGNDTLRGDGGNDLLRGDAGDDILEGGSGNDTLLGGNGYDMLWGGDGNDTLNGGAGHDTLYGDAGADVLHGDEGHDLIHGGDGDDTLLGGAGHDSLFGDLGADLLDGGPGNDDVFGGEGNDTLIGGAGHDSLFGGAGDDLLQGGDGSDTLAGGAGSDTLAGGLGADVFVFSAAEDLDGSIDVILDFQSNEDRIDLSGLGLTFIGTDDFSGLGQVRADWSQAGAHRLLVDLDGDGTAELTIALGGLEQLNASDLLL